MPKLKKHSAIHIDVSQDISSDSAKEVEETQADQFVEESNSFVPSRMKCSDRVKLFEQEAQKKKEKKPRKKKQTSKEKPSESIQPRQDSQINKFVGKYSDDDDFAIDGDRKGRLKRKSQKPHKPEIKTKNKMFADVSFQHELDEQKAEEHQQLDISVEKRERRQSNHLLDKFQQKAISYKNKLDFKDLNKDHRYRKNMTEKLKEIKEVEEVNIVVQVPKIFGGNRSEIQTALFLKNAAEKGTQQLTDPNKAQKEKGKEDDENTVNMDRKTYYDDLGKQLRMKKAETLTQNVLKDRFKKSMLDDQDYIHDFRDNNGTNSISEVSENSYSHQLKYKSLRETRINRNSAQADENHESNRDSLSIQQRSSRGTKGTPRLLLPPQKPEDIPENEEISSVLPSSQQAFDKEPEINHDNTQISLKTESKVVPSEIIYKTAKPINIKKKTNQFKFKNLIEVEAQISDDEQEGGPKHRDENDSDIDDDDTNLHSLIDDDVQVNSKDRYKVHKKFIEDMIEMEDKKYQEMKNAMEKKYIQQEQKMKKRMEEVAKKNLERDQVQEKELYTEAEEEEKEEEKSKSCNNSNSIALKKNMEKLDELEEFLNGEKKTEKQRNKVPEMKLIKKLDDLQKAIMGENPKSINRVERKGLKNVKAHKKPIVIKPKK